MAHASCWAVGSRTGKNADAPLRGIVETARTEPLLAAGSRPSNTPIVLFLVFGACFGLATYNHRHLFSEGPTQATKSTGSEALMGRLLWAAICTFLWPLMALTGLYSWWRLSRRAKAVQANKR